MKPENPKKSQSKTYDVIVVGAGHAGCEAALAAAKMGRRTLMITASLDKIATLPCNPSIGGPGKGHLVREIGALGGVMAEVADASAIQMKELNTSKGPAVRAYRAQIEQTTYNAEMRRRLESAVGLTLHQGEVRDIVAPKGYVEAVVTAAGETFVTKTVIICTGTFMSGQIIIGDRIVRDGGRMDEGASTGLTGSLNALGLTHGRLKTGTPPRIARDSIDYDKLERAEGTAGPISFSYPAREILASENQVPCWLGYTNSQTHELIKANLDKSPIFNGLAGERAPRSCPSLDRKVANFPDRDRHPIFIEPTGRNEDKMYIQGGSLAFPEALQEQIIHTIVGLENARFLAHGYSVVYDFFHPHQLTNSLETKAVRGLFLAGQINGTTGYEEAAAQGLIAGINASRRATDEAPVTLGRDQAYIGVLIDDLVTKTHVEPYRIFTSRAEYRLLLRNDNADQRLSALGHKLGLISDEAYQLVQNKMTKLVDATSVLQNTRGKLSGATVSAWQYLSRPEVDIAEARGRFGLPEFGRELDEQLELTAKYSGYFGKQARLAEKLNEQTELPLHPALAYDEIAGLRNEARARLAEVTPTTLGQASRIQGITPADLSIIMIANHRLKSAVN